MTIPPPNSSVVILPLTMWIAETELDASSVAVTAFVCILAVATELPASCAVLTCASSICFVKILF